MNTEAPIIVVRTIRDDLIQSIAGSARSLLLSADEKGMEKAVRALAELHQAATKAIRDLSASNPGYEVRDLPVNVREAYEESARLISRLQALYYPQQDAPEGMTRA